MSNPQLFPEQNGMQNVVAFDEQNNEHYTVIYGAKWRGHHRESQ